MVCLGPSYDHQQNEKRGLMNRPLVLDGVWCERVVQVVACSARVVRQYAFKFENLNYNLRYSSVTPYPSTPFVWLVYLLILIVYVSTLYSVCAEGFSKNATLGTKKSELPSPPNLVVFKQKTLQKPTSQTPCFVPGIRQGSGAARQTAG